MLNKLANANVHRYIDHPRQPQALRLGYAAVVLTIVGVMLRKNAKADTTS